MTRTREQKEMVLRRQFHPSQPAPISTPTSAPGSLPAQALQWPPFTRSEVVERLGRAKPDTAPGPDGIPWRVLKTLALGWPAFADIITDLFNLCISSGCHPDAFKTATIVVIRKPGKPDYTRAGAYRPISLLPTMAKLLEGLVAGRILRAAELSDVIASGHWGGRPHRSTGDALTRLVQFVRDGLRRNDHVGLVALDVEGAYNCVDRDVLCRDLGSRGIPSQVVAWALSFCTERREAMRLGTTEGVPYEVNTGLPQGSPVSQLLWAIYSSDLVGATQTGATAQKELSIGWVDDWTLAIRRPSQRRLQEALQQRLDAAAEWARTHHASFDMDKAGSLAFNKANGTTRGLAVRLGPATVPSRETIKILGVTFQPNLKWTAHSTQVIGKASRV
jgi:hypothetical protein